MKLQRLLPNAITTAGGLSALYGLTVVESSPRLAVLLLVMGQVLDMLDGAVARRLDVCTRFGAQLDWSFDVTVAQAALTPLGLTWLSPVLAYVQAASLADPVALGRITGRTITVLTVATLALWGAS